MHRNAEDARQDAMGSLAALIADYDEAIVRAYEAREWATRARLLAERDKATAELRALEAAKVAS